MSLKNKLQEFYPDSRFIVLDGLDECVLGVSYVDGESALVYSIELIMKKLCQGGMTEEEAQEYYDFNIAGAFYGDNSPIYVETYIF